MKLSLPILLPIMLVLLLSQSELHAQIPQKDCGNFDIREQHPNLKEHFSKPLDQDSIGWCYGFVAADLLTIETGVPVSPVHMSAIYNREVVLAPRKHEERLQRSFLYRLKNKFSHHYLANMPTAIISTGGTNSLREIYQMGAINLALKVAREEGAICSEARLPFDQNHSREVYLQLRALEQLKVQLFTTDPAKSCELIEETLPRIGFNHFDLEQIQYSLINENINIALAKLVEKQCQGAMVPVPQGLRPKEVYKVSTDVKHKFLKNLNKQVGQGKAVGIGYDSSQVLKEGGENHASLVVARRWQNGRCEYKIRNTWGRACAVYKKGFECLPDEGAFWLADRDLERVSFSFTYLK